jgi:negative regulator of sigma E activity
MSPIDDALRNALRREEAPEDFPERVLARLTQQESALQRGRRQRWFRMFSQPLVRWAAFAAVSASLIVGTVHYRNLQRERARGEAAKQQLMLALRIAGSKLQLAKTKVNEINQSEPATQSPANRSRSRS